MPKARFAYIFPSKSGALIQVRIKLGPERARARPRDRGHPRRDVAMPEWRLPNGKGDYVVTGAPVVVDDLTRSISHSLVAAARRRARSSWRSRSRSSSARGCGCCRSSSRWPRPRLTFGALSLVGASLTMASIAVLPGADRPGGRLRDPAAVARAGGRRPPAAGHRGGGQRAAARGAPDGRDRRGGHARRASSCSCSRRCRWCAASGCCSWRASRSRCGCALTLGVAALRAARARRGRARGAGARGRSRRPGAAPASCSRPTARPRARCAGAARAAGPRCARACHRAPGPRRARGAARVAVVGWGLDTQTRVESDVHASSCPQNLARSHDLAGAAERRPASAARSTCSSRAAASPTRPSCAG